MFRKLKSSRGETLSEVLTAAVVAVMALLLLTAALSRWPTGIKSESEPSRSSVRTRFDLGEESYEIDIDVTYDEYGYSYVEE